MHNFFKCSNFCPNVNFLILFQDFILDNIILHIWSSPKLFLAATVSQTFFAFDDLVSFKDCWGDVLYNAPQVGFV